MTYTKRRAKVERLSTAGAAELMLCLPEATDRGRRCQLQQFIIPFIHNPLPCVYLCLYLCPSSVRLRMPLSVSVRLPMLSAAGGCQSLGARPLIDRRWTVPVGPMMTIMQQHLASCSRAPHLLPASVAAHSTDGKGRLTDR